jgi:hypothetical protein
MRAWLTFAALAICLSATGCKRQKPPVATTVYLGPHGGCIATAPVADQPNTMCWGALPGDKEPGKFAARRKFGNGETANLGIGEKLACFAERNHDDWHGGNTPVRCWTDADPTPKLRPEKGDKEPFQIGVATGCLQMKNELHCFGEDPGPDWTREAILQAFAVGGSHICAAYQNDGVVCHGKTATDAGLLAKLNAIELTAGEDHTCALLSDHTVKCWGKNESGQLGDQTMTDSAVPVSVLGVAGVAHITAGAHHTCALIGNGTVWCWGNNTHHQLANGETKNNGRAAMVLGLIGVSQIVAAGEGTCARLFTDGEVRCWGRNDAAQLGDGTLQEHTVPAPIKFK